MANSVYQSLDVVAPIATPGEISKTTPVEGKDTEAGGLGIVDGEGNDKIQAAELSEAPSAEPEKVHEYYNDPAADIEVVAKDGTIFRAYKHILRRKSNFFADLLSSPSETEGSLTPIARIALEDHDNSTVVTLLDLIAPSSLSQLPYPLATPDLMSVYRLADYLGCDAICKLLRSVVNDQANTAQLLQLASQTNDDADFIRQALTKARNRFLDVVDHASLVTSTALRIREEICTLPHRYRVELGLRLTMIHSNTGTYQKNWGGWEWLELGAEVDAFVKAIRGEPAVVQAQAEAEPKVRPTSAKPRRNNWFSR